MKKLLLAAGEKALSAATMDFVCYLARLTRSRLTGLFPATAQEKATALVQPPDGERTGEGLPGRQIRRFEEACAARDVAGLVHTPTGETWDDFIMHTRFADAIVIDPDFTLHEDTREPSPSHWAKKVLHEAACPVIIAPPSFDGISEIILTYDGSKPSLLAIREFCQLFPELRHVKASILQIWLEEDEHAKDQQEMQHWLQLHFDQVESVVLEGTSRERLIEYLLSHPGAFVVMGGFSRSRFSRLFQPSASGDVVKLVSSPLFIAH